MRIRIIAGLAALALAGCQQQAEPSDTVAAGDVIDAVPTDAEPERATPIEPAPVKASPARPRPPERDPADVAAEQAAADAAATPPAAADQPGPSEATREGAKQAAEETNLQPHPTD